MEAKTPISFEEEGAVVSKEAKAAAKKVKGVEGVKRALFFDIAKSSHLISQHGFKRAEFYILADTSYGEDGVDEVAAEHSNADLIIHYGRAAFENPRKMPVLFVPGRGNFDKNDFISKFTLQFPSTSEKILVFADGMYHYVTDDLKTELCHHKGYKSVLVTKIDLAKKFPDASESTNPLEESQNITKFEFCGRYIEGKLDGERKDYKILFLGGECTTLTNIALSFNQSEIFSYDPNHLVLRRESLAVNKLLSRRFVLIEKAQDANIIGILVGTLAVDKYLSVIEYMKTIIKDAEKKYYVFVVGKLNIAKLANFADIDLWVLVAGAEHSLIDSKEYFRPIVTPFELEIALVSGKEWCLDYILDFTTLLDKRDELHHTAEDLEDTRVSLVSGRVIEKRNALTPTAGNSLVAAESNNELAKYEASALFLQKSYKGLEQKLGETAVTLAVEGKSGIPFVGYQGEGGKQTSTTLEKK